MPLQIEPYSMARKFNASQGVPSDSRGAQLAGATSSYYEGYIVDLIQHLATRVGFKYRLVPVWDGMFGHRQQDGTWNGMIGELMRRVSINNVFQIFCYLLAKI